MPESFDPMTVKELRQSLRRGSFVTPFLAVHALALAAMVIEFKQGSTSGASEYSGVLNLWILANSGPFWAIVGTICVLLMPLGGLFLMGQELEEGNHELLQLTTLNRWKIVVGKFTALWGLSVVTFASVLPYMVVRYLVGGVEWWHEAACAGSVLGASAMVGAGAIGASAFQNMGVRMAVFLLFIASMAGGVAPPLVGSAAVGNGCGILYHITAVTAVFCYVVVGLSLARSRLRLAVMAYEVKPGGMMLGILVFSPFLVGLITVFTCGAGGVAGLVVLALLAWKADTTPKITVPVNATLPGTSTPMSRTLPPDEPAR